MALPAGLDAAGPAPQAVPRTGRRDADGEPAGGLASRQAVLDRLHHPKPKIHAHRPPHTVLPNQSGQAKHGETYRPLRLRDR